MSNHLARTDMTTQQTGAALAKSGYFEDAKSEAQAIVKVLAGQEMGFGPIASMTGIHVIKGKIAVGANLMAAAIKRSGKYNYRVLELTAQVCELAFFEAGQEVGRSRFTAVEAAQAGTQNMQKYPKNMLFARALSNGVKWYAADVFLGAPVYTPEELGATVDDEGDVISLPAEPPQRTAPAPAVRTKHHAALNMPEKHWAHEQLDGAPLFDEPASRNVTPAPTMVTSGRDALLAYAIRMVNSPQASDMERDLDLDELSTDQLSALINDIRGRVAAGVGDEVFVD